MNCQDEPNEYGVCDNWWIDPATNDSYALFNLGNMEENYFDLMNTMFSEGWTTGEDLFLGSDICADNQYGIGWGFQGPYPSIDSLTLETNCFPNLRVCIWNQTNNPAMKDGYEFLSGISCAFAWPNTCINGEGFHLNDTSAANGSVETFGSDESFDDVSSQFGGPAFFLFNSSTANYSYQFALWEDTYRSINFTNSPVSEKEGYPPWELLGYNSLFDTLNNPIGALQQQASNMNPKQCQELPRDAFDRPGWGGAGYHQKDNDCDKVPASYLGPGLYFDAAFCGPKQN